MVRKLKNHGSQIIVHDQASIMVKHKAPSGKVYEVKRFEEGTKIGILMLEKTNLASREYLALPIGTDLSKHVMITDMFKKDIDGNDSTFYKAELIEHIPVVKKK